MRKEKKSDAPTAVEQAPRHGEDPALEVSLLFTRKSTFFCIVVSYHAHGDVVQLTNAATGVVTKNYSYDAFGNEKTAVTGVNPYRYCGEYNDLETGMYYRSVRRRESANPLFTNCGGRVILIA